MLDLRQLEIDPDGVKAALEKRGEIPALSGVLELAAARKAKITALQTDQEERNRVNAKMKGASKEEIDKNRAELRALSDKIKEAEAEVKKIEEELEARVLNIPNIPAADVPVGADEHANLEVRKVGTPRSFDFEVKDHVDLGTALGIFDLERAAKVSGSRFAFMKNDAVRLNRALIAYMTDFHRERGDTELWTPYLVNRASMTGTGQLPKFEEDAFKVPRGDTDPLYLIPTAEVPLTNYFADEILEGEDLPIRFCAHTPCFRAEAGSAGRDTRGLIRQHQFDKVEMVRFAAPEQAEAELDAMVDRASAILSELELPHRVVLLCSGDMGFSAEKTFDLEVWLPSQGTYREISSCSSFGTFQARRAKIRYRPVSDDGGAKKAKPRIAVTLNGSGLAVGRTLIAILENHQQADGSVIIPERLRPYMGGQDRILASR